MNVVIHYPSDTVQIVDFTVTKLNGQRVIYMPTKSAMEMGKRLQDAAETLEKRRALLEETKMADQDSWLEL